MIACRSSHTSDKLSFIHAEVDALANYRCLFHLQRGVEYAFTKYLNPPCVFIPEPVFMAFVMQTD